MDLPKQPPYFSIILPTYRPGGLDLVVKSLSDQPPIYELLVVDAFPGRVERGQATKYILDAGIPLCYFGPPLENKRGMARAYNTGAAFATTPHLIFTQDFCWYPPGFVLSWLSRLQKGNGNTSIAGSAILRVAAAPEQLGDISIWTGNPFHYIGEEIELWTPTHWEMFNTYLPLSFFEAVNGLDERGTPIHCFAATLHQLAVHGLYPEVAPQLRIGMIDHRRWGGDLWSTCEPTRVDAKPLYPLEKVSPNPYDFVKTREANETR